MLIRLAADRPPCRLSALMRPKGTAPWPAESAVAWGWSEGWADSSCAGSGGACQTAGLAVATTAVMSIARVQRPYGAGKAWRTSGGSHPRERLSPTAPRRPPNAARRRPDGPSGSGWCVLVAVSADSLASWGVMRHSGWRASVESLQHWRVSEANIAHQAHQGPVDLPTLPGRSVVWHRLPVCVIKSTTTCRSQEVKHFDYRSSAPA